LEVPVGLLWTAHMCRSYYSYFIYTFGEFCAILFPRLVLEETASSIDHWI